MGSRIYRLRASRTTSGDAAAQIDIRRNGIIKSVYWTILSQTSVAACCTLWEVSFNAASQFLANDAAAIISGMAVSSAAAAPISKAEAHMLNQVVRVADRVYLHALFIVGNETITGFASLIVEE
jgi:hypothetical protein